MLDTKDSNKLLQTVAAGLISGFFCPLLMGKNVFSLFLSGFSFWLAIRATYFIYLGGSNLKEKVLCSDDKVNSFIMHTNSTISSKLPSKDILALPVYELPTKKSYLKVYYIQPLLTMDNLDSFLIKGNYNLKSYRIRISGSEYEELRNLLNNNIEEFNEEIVKRGYSIS